MEHNDKQHNELHDVKSRHPEHLHETIHGAHDAIAKASPQTPDARLRAFLSYEGALLSKMASDPNTTFQKVQDGFMATGAEFGIISRWINHGV